MHLKRDNQFQGEIVLVRRSESDIYLPPICHLFYKFMSTCTTKYTMYLTNNLSSIQIFGGEIRIEHITHNLSCHHVLKAPALEVKSAHKAMSQTFEMFYKNCHIVYGCTLVTPISVCGT